jgi:hypothetical protein
MKLIALLVGVALLLTWAVPALVPKAKAQETTVQNLINMLPTTLVPFATQLMALCSTGTINALLSTLNTILTQCLLNVRTICAQNPEFQQSLINDVVLCASIGAIAGMCFPLPFLTMIVGTPLFGIIGALLGIPIGLIDGWLRWTGFFNPAPSDIDAAKAQAELDKAKQPQYIIITPGR